MSCLTRITQGFVVEKGEVMNEGDISILNAIEEERKHKGKKVSRNSLSPLEVDEQGSQHLLTQHFSPAQGNRAGQRNQDKTLLVMSQFCSFLWSY